MEINTVRMTPKAIPPMKISQLTDAPRYSLFLHLRGRSLVFVTGILCLIRLLTDHVPMNS